MNFPRRGGSLHHRTTRSENDIDDIYELVGEIQAVQQVHTERFDNVDKRFDKLDTRVDQLEQKVETRFGQLDDKLDRVLERLPG